MKIYIEALIYEYWVLRQKHISYTYVWISIYTHLHMSHGESIERHSFMNLESWGTNIYHIHIYECIYIYDTTHSYVWHESGLIHMCDMSLAGSMSLESWGTNTCHIHISEYIHIYICTWVMERHPWEVYTNEFVCRCWCTNESRMRYERVHMYMRHGESPMGDSPWLTYICVYILLILEPQDSTLPKSWRIAPGKLTRTSSCIVFDARTSREWDVNEISIYLILEPQYSMSHGESRMGDSP